MIPTDCKKSINPSIIETQNVSLTEYTLVVNQKVGALPNHGISLPATSNTLTKNSLRRALHLP